MQSPRPYIAYSAARSGLLIVLLAVVGMLVVAYPSAPSPDGAVTSYFFDGPDDDTDLSSDGKCCSTIPTLTFIRTQAERHQIDLGHIARLPQRTTPPPSRAPPGTTPV